MVKGAGLRYERFPVRIPRNIPFHFGFFAFLSLIIIYFRFEFFDWLPLIMYIFILNISQWFHSSAKPIQMKSSMTFIQCNRFEEINIVAAFRGMHVSPATHSYMYAWLPRKWNYRTDRRRTKWSLCAAMLFRRHKNCDCLKELMLALIDWYKTNFYIVLVNTLYLFTSIYFHLFIFTNKFVM